MGRTLKKDSTPIIFIHFGDSFYLKLCFEMAVRYNPDKDVVLIGDKDNQHYERFGIRHFDFNSYARGAKIDSFNTSFTYIAGPDFVGGERWTKFNFHKMFVLDEFTSQHDISKFWLFDSDVLITESLLEHEQKFKNVIYSFHNEYYVPQGLVHSNPFLQDFSAFLVDSYADPAFLENAKAEINFEANPQFGLTYMYFFKKFNEQRNLELMNYQTVIEGEAFNPLLFQSHGMSTYNIQPFKYPLKETWFYPSGEVFNRNLESGDYVKLITINLSWLPEFLIQRIYKHAKKFKGNKRKDYNFSRLKKMHLNKNNWLRWRRRFASLFKRG